MAESSENKIELDNQSSESSTTDSTADTANRLMVKTRLNRGTCKIS